MSEKPETESKEPENKEEAEEKIIESPKVPSKASEEQNIIYIGRKPPMDYVMAVITSFNMKNGEEITLKARGRAISTAVDVAEIIRNRFLKDAKIHSVSIGTEELPPREGGNPRNVSTMEIRLKK